VHPRARMAVAILSVAMAGAVAFLPAAATTRAAGLSMTAQVLLGGNTRLGSWAAIVIDLVNDGPAVTGEVHLTGGSQGRTRYAVPVELPTGSNKRVTLYAQPSPFRSTFDIALVAADGTEIATDSLKVVNHDAFAPLVAVIAERPEGLVPGVKAALNTNQQPAAATVVTLTPADLPDRVEGWGPLDRVVWQDVSMTELSSAQLEALRGWIAGGGRLVLLGGTSGAATLNALPDELLPFRPTATVDMAPEDLAALAGKLPDVAKPLPSLAGTLVHGRPLARSGDAVTAASEEFGRGSVTLIGFDPATTWLASSSAGAVLWRVALPNTGGSQPTTPGNLADDSQLVQALSFLPSLDLPPIDLLVLLVVLYTVLIGPLNYLVLKRLDRRELAWVTMPSLVLVFSVVSYGLGVSLHGTDTIVNELSIVRGTAGTDAGRAQVYFGVFSPTRRSFDVGIGGPALVTSPLSEFQQTASQAGLDVVQGDHPQVRGLEVSVADLRAFRGELATAAPRIDADLRLEGSSIKGTVTNRSDRLLEHPAVVMGSNVVGLNDLAAGASAQVDLGVRGSTLGLSLSDELFGPAGQGTADTRSASVRRAMVDQLSQGASKFATGFPDGDMPVFIAWGTEPIVPVTIGTEHPQQVADTLYLVSLPLRAVGKVALVDPLIGHQIVDSTATWASDDGSSLSLGDGSMTVAYQAIPLGGDLRATKLALAMVEGGNLAIPVPAPAPLPPVQGGGSGGSTGGGATGTPPPEPAPIPGKPGLGQGVPSFELFDRAASSWTAFATLNLGQAATIDHPERFVDGSGGLLVRFTYADPQAQGQQVYFNLVVSIEGVVE
jgi:hypothetical protein